MTDADVDRKVELAAETFTDFSFLSEIQTTTSKSYVKYQALGVILVVMR